MKKCNQGIWKVAVVAMAVMFLLGMAGREANAAIKITGIMYNPYGDNEANCTWEWVEIQNNGSSSVSLLGYVLDDGNGTKKSSSQIISSTTTIGSGQFAYLYNADYVSEAAFKRIWGKCIAIPVPGWAANGFNNDGDKVGIWSSYSSYENDYSTHNNAVDSVQYGVASPWPVSTDGKEIYMQNVTSNNDTGTNWTLAIAGDMGQHYGVTTRYVMDSIDSVEYAAVFDLKPRLMITQIMYNPDGNEADREWVEIFNSWPIAVNVAGSVLDDKNGTAHSSANISNGTILPGKTAYLVPEVYYDYFQDIWGRCNVISVSGWATMGLNNGGDGVGLWKNYSEYSGDQATHNNTIDSVAYGAASPWPVSQDGHSIYLNAVGEIDYQNGANWTGTDIANRSDIVSAGGIIDRNFIAKGVEGDYDYAAVDTNPDGQKMVFRYRSFTGSRPDWVSPITTVGNIVHQLTPTGDVVSVSRGSGFESFITTDFDGTSEYIQAASAINTHDIAGDDGFTVQAWFKADSISGTRTLFSNLSGTTGFRLGISSGKLFGQVYFMNNNSQTTLKTIGTGVPSANVVVGYWYYAAFQVKTSDSNYELRLYLDDNPVCDTMVLSDILPNGYIRQSALSPTVGIYQATNFFDGRISAVCVSNYPMYFTNYISVDRVLDGGCYFGNPYYHDSDMMKNLDYIYQRTATDYHYSDVMEHITQRFQVPFMNDNYVPQGLAYNSDNDYLYLAMYWKDMYDNTGAYPSILAEINRSNGKLRHAYKLCNLSGSALTTHGSAVAYCNGYMYVTDSNYVYKYAPGVNNNNVFNTHTFENCQFGAESLTAVSRFGFTSSVKFLDACTIYDGSNILWVGKTINDHFWIYGFLLNSSGNVGSLIHAFELPDELNIGVQGLVCYDSYVVSGYKYFKFYVTGFYDGSYDTPAKLFYAIFKESYSVAQASGLVTMLPPGVEDLAMVGNDVWTSAESGSRCYQKQATGVPWVLMYPFIYGLDGDELLFKTNIVMHFFK